MLSAVSKHIGGQAIPSKYNISRKMAVLALSVAYFELSLKKLNFQAVIKSAASAASLDLQGPTDDGSACGRRRSGAPLQIHGGCASSRLDHGLKV